MTNLGWCNSLRADCDYQPQQNGGVDAVGTIEGEGSYGSPTGILLDGSFADYSGNTSQIDIMLGGRSATRNLKSVTRGEHSALTTTEITTASEHCPPSKSAAIWYVTSSSRMPLAESSWEVRVTNEPAPFLPFWTRAARASRAGMFIPGLLTALAVFAAIGGILSTVLELAWF
jgi:hypothetical protein